MFGNTNDHFKNVNTVIHDNYYNLEFWTSQESNICKSGHNAQAVPCQYYSLVYLSTLYQLHRLYTIKG